MDHVHNRYGAPVGRPEAGRWLDKATPLRLALRRVRINRSGYDDGGAYWGLGPPLYWTGDEDGTVSRYLRAPDRAAAKRQIMTWYPAARFYR